MAERKGINSLPLDSPKLDFDKIPKLDDFLSDISANRSQFLNKKEDIPKLVLVINQVDPTRSSQSSNGSVSKNIF